MRVYVSRPSGYTNLFTHTKQVPYLAMQTPVPGDLGPDPDAEDGAPLVPVTPDHYRSALSEFFGKVLELPFTSYAQVVSDPVGNPSRLTVEGLTRFAVSGVRVRLMHEGVPIGQEHGEPLWLSAEHLSLPMNAGAHFMHQFMQLSAWQHHRRALHGIPGPDYEGGPLAEESREERVAHLAFLTRLLASRGVRVAPLLCWLVAWTDVYSTELHSAWSRAMPLRGFNRKAWTALGQRLHAHVETLDYTRDQLRSALVQTVLGKPGLGPTINTLARKYLDMVRDTGRLYEEVAYQTRDGMNLTCTVRWPGGQETQDEVMSENYPLVDEVARIWLEEVRASVQVQDSGLYLPLWYRRELEKVTPQAAD